MGQLVKKELLSFSGRDTPGALPKDNMSANGMGSGPQHPSGSGGAISRMDTDITEGEIPPAPLQYQASAPPCWLRGEKRPRPLEQLRPAVVAKRDAFRKAIAEVSVEKLVFLDDSGMNLSMSCSDSWVPKGYEYADHRPMNWSMNLTLLGAIRLSGWVQLTAQFATANGVRFVRWLTRRLLRPSKDVATFS